MQIWLGTGGDLGGSLRIPASFCGVVGMRTSWGRVPQQFTKASDVRVIGGPMARNVPDLALALDAMAGQHQRYKQEAPQPRRPFTSTGHRLSQHASEHAK